MPITLQSRDIPTHNHQNGIRIKSRRTLHILDNIFPIQSIFQSNIQHNHIFNYRHHSHDENPNQQVNASKNHHKNSKSHQVNKEPGENRDMEADLAGHNRTQNVTRILVNSTIPRERNGKYY